MCGVRGLKGAALPKFETYVILGTEGTLKHLTSLLQEQQVPVAR